VGRSHRASVCVKDAPRADGLPAVENLRRPPWRSLAARAVIVGWALAVLVALELVSLTPAAAQTVLTATDGASLASALATIDNNPNTSFTLNITHNITLTSATTLPAIISNSTVTVNGNGNTLDGGSVQRGLFVYTGTVALSNLTIQNTLAQGGNGVADAGGGMGASGALFVASGGNVTVSDVALANNQAIGGAGGHLGANGAGGGGGGMGGAGGNVPGSGGGGGGGLGLGAAGGNTGVNGSSGIALGQSAGGNGTGSSSGTGGATGGGGGGGQSGADSTVVAEEELAASAVAQLSGAVADSAVAVVAAGIIPLAMAGSAVAAGTTRAHPGLTPVMAVLVAAEAVPPPVRRVSAVLAQAAEGLAILEMVVGAVAPVSAVPCSCKGRLPDHQRRLHGERQFSDRRNGR
jgi:hypothetical protein